MCTSGSGQTDDRDTQWKGGEGKERKRKKVGGKDQRGSCWWTQHGNLIATVNYYARVALALNLDLITSFLTVAYKLAKT